MAAFVDDPVDYFGSSTVTANFAPIGEMKGGASRAAGVTATSLSCPYTSSQPIGPIIGRRKAARSRRKRSRSCPSFRWRPPPSLQSL